MERAGSYRKSKIKVEDEKKLVNVLRFISNIDAKIALAILIGFLISRVTMLYMMSSAGIAYLSLFAFSGTGYYGVLISVVLGIVSIGNKTDIFKYLIAVAIITTFNFFVGKKEDRLPLQAIMGSIAILLAGIIKAAINGVSFYFTLMAILESILVFTLIFVFNKAISKITDETTKKFFSNEELISIAILIGGAIVGIGDMNLGNLYIRDVLVLFIVMVIGYKGGAVAGTSAGMTLGLFMLLSNNFTAEQVVIISGAGLVCGLMQELGKIGSGIGFIMGGLLLSIYLNKNVIDNRIYIASSVVFIVFIFIPTKFYNHLRTALNFDENLEDKEYMMKVQDVTSEKLKAFSGAFNKLADTFNNLSEKRTSLSQTEISRLFDDVAAKVCSDCGMTTYCWENYFYDTYQTMFSILSAAEKKGSISETDIPLNFKTKCVKLGDFVDTTNRIFELYKNNLVWHNRIIESRKLISEQLVSVSTIINNLSTDIKLELNFKGEIERCIKAELNKNNLVVNRVIVLENKYKKYEICLSIKPCYGRKVCTKEIIPIVSKIVDRKMKPQNIGCNISKVEKICNLKLIEQQKYRVMSGVARAIKDNNVLSGDNYTFMEIKYGQCLMALSDGMGSGNRANKESKASIELLEEFLESGFDKDVAIKMINSVLVLKSGEESFSTLDMCVVDMYNGEAEFIKIGAASTYIKRNNIIEVIRSTSLPVGILNNVDMEITRKKLKANDLVIMITDGIIDANINIEQKEEWIENILKDFKSNNPQDVADYILQEAKNNSGGYIQDDMTILVTRFWERV